MMNLLPERCLTHEEADFVMQRLLPDGRRIALIPHGGYGEMEQEQGITLAISLKPPFHTLQIFDERYYEYADTRQALLAFHSWNPYEQREPEGWMSHPATNRYRPQGKRALEYVHITRGSTTERIIAAIQATQGSDRVVREIRQIEAKESPFLPSEIHHFVVESFSILCPHTPTHRSWDSVFVSMDRCVVYTLNEIFSFSMEVLIERLIR